MSKMVTFKVTKEILKESVEKLEKNSGVGYYPANCAIATVVGKLYPAFSCGISSGVILGKEAQIHIPDYVGEYIRSFDMSTNEERLLLPELEFTLEMPEYEQ